MTQPLLRTPLHSAHHSAGARLVPFSDYELPVQYPPGVLAEHRWTRVHAGLFDVSHMGPARIRLNRPTGDGEADHRAVCALIEPLLSGDIAGLQPGQLRYTLLLNPEGGVLDDLMVGRPAAPQAQGSLYVVVNAATKAADFALIAEVAGDLATLQRLDKCGLLALQGPAATDVVQRPLPEAPTLGFMRFATLTFKGSPAIVSRSGYTGEDGFEILIAAEMAETLWAELLADDRVAPIGLGARDSLRLEAGLPLYGHDLDESVSPIEAGLGFAVSKRRRLAGDLRGAERIERELAGGLKRVRVGLRVLSGAPAREGAAIVGLDGAPLGQVTSGGFSPSLGIPIAMGFVPPSARAPGTQLQVVVRERAQPAQVATLPFLPHHHVRKLREELIDAVHQGP